MRYSLGAVLAMAIVTTLSAPAAAMPTDEFVRGEVARAATSPKAGKCTVTGTKKDDVLKGTGGNDVLCGKGGDDVLKGGGGNDLLLAGPGDDVLKGGAGADRLVANGDTTYRDVLVCGGGTDQAAADAEDQVKAGCEKLQQPTVPTPPAPPTPPTPPTPTTPNTAPSGADKTLAIVEDGSHPFAAGDFGFSDPADSHQLLAVLLTSVPAAGTLKLGGANVSAGQSVPAASIPDLVFAPASNAHGSSYASFGFRVRDNGGTSGGGVDTDPTPNTITINVTPVNDAPAFTKGPNQTVANKDSGGQPVAYTINPWATGISPGPNEAGQTVTFTVTTNNNALFNTVPAVSSTGVLTFTPDPTKVGTATVTVGLQDSGGTSNGGDDTSDSQTFTIETVAPVAPGSPVITSISPSPLVPGASATLTGQNFSPTAASNVVTIGGASAPVTAANATTLTVTVPCVSSGSGVPVKAAVSGTDTNTVNHPLQVNQRALAVGEAAIIANAAEVGCNEIASAGGAARYVIAAYNASTNPSANAPVQLSADLDGEDPARLSRRSSDILDLHPLAPSPVVDEHGEHGPGHLQSSEGGDAHMRLLEGNREQYEVLRARFGTEGVQSRPVYRAATDLPLTRSFRVANINAGNNFCNSYYVGSATRVYAEGKLVIYEDDATPAAFKAASNPAMASYYDKIGDQFNADMEPIIRNNFGDILLRDAVTDNNGVMIAISTPRLNNTFTGVAGFVVSCDQFPEDDTGAPPVGGPYTGSGINGSSNFGEYFYLYQPTVNAAGYSSGNTPDSWYRTVRSTFIHESKHVASQAARTAKGAPYEAAWLEEGTARHSEELWARESIYNVAWKGNTGYGSAGAPNSIYCDLRPSTPACTTSNPRRPSLNMYRHFSSMYTYLALSNSSLLSPFGPSPYDNASYWYATSWSLVRYAIDRYGASDAAFLKGLTDASTTGVVNLAQQTGVTTEQLLGRWALALSVDDYPGMTGASADVQMPTWNFRDIYAGLFADGQTGVAYPSVPESHPFGTFTASVPELYGGGVKLFQLSGTQTQAQLLRLQGSGGGALPSTVRLSIVRVE